MPTKKPVKKVAAEVHKREAFHLYEQVMEFFLSWALDGAFYIDDMNRAKAAFDTMDVDTLRKLSVKYATQVDNFIEAEDALREYLPKMKPVELENGKTRKFRMEDYSQRDRCNILPTIPGTRAYARKLLEAQGNGTPFDE